MSRKNEPAVQTLTLVTPSVAESPNGENFYLDLSQIASLVNRRFYRQGLNWAVAGFKILTAGNGSLTTFKLPNTWVMSNAWEKGYHAYRKMNNEALEESESARPRFEDFKIFADARHHNKGYAANLLPVTFTISAAGALTVDTATVGEWQSSKLFQPLTGPAAADPGQVAEREVLAVGPNYPGAGASGLDAVSLIEGYANSRALPAIVDPNVPDDLQDTDGGTPENWLGSLFNDGTQQSSEALGTLTNANDQAPYPFENDGVHADTQYPNGEAQLTGMEIHDFSFITPTTIGGTTRIKGGMFPCGLVGFNWSPNGSSNLSIQVDLVPGPHRGYLCQKMQDM